jgi:hypothetical protein
MQAAAFIEGIREPKVALARFGGEHVEIMNMIDDHSHLFLASAVYHTAVKAQDVVDVFHKAIELHGYQHHC